MRYLKEAKIIIIFFAISFSVNAKEYNILNFCAKGDDLAIETKAIQSTVDEQKFKEIIIQE